MLQPNGLYWLGLGGGGCALLYALLLSRQLKKPLEGSSGLHRAKSLLKQSALSLLKWHGVLLFALLALGFGILMALRSLALRSMDRLPNPYLPVAFLTGALCALLPQLLDLRFMPRRAAQTAATMEASPKRGLVFLLVSSKVRAFATLGLTLLEVSGWICYLTLQEELDPAVLAETLLTFGLGGAVVALFARHLGLFSATGILGSHPLTDKDKAIPPEDQRNPASAVRALSSCLHEPVAGPTAAWRCLLPAAFVLGLLSYGPESLGIQAMLFPLLVACTGALASLVSSLRGFPQQKPLEKRHYRRLWANLWLTLILTAAVAMPFSFLMFGTLRLSLPLLPGLLCAPAVAWSAQLSALSVSTESPDSGKVPVTVWLVMGLYGALPLLLLLCALLGAFFLAGGWDSPVTGLYGVTLAGVGLLAPMGDLLTFSSCGSLAQGAIALTWMSGDMAQPDWAPDLELMGKRLSYAGRGYSLAVTLTASLLLLLAWTGIYSPLPAFSPALLGGILLGLILVCGVTALQLLGAKKASDSLWEETQRQFKASKGLRSGKTAPHALPCVDLTNIHSLFWTLAGIFLALVLSALTGALMGVPGLLGLLVTVIVLTPLPGFFLISAGDYWAGTPLANAVLPFRWAAGPALGELALLVLTAVLTLM